MAKKSRHKSRRPKTQQKRPILNSVKETAVQLRAMGHTYNEIADKTNISYQSVENILKKWAPNNPERVKKARAKALEELAGELTAKAREALDHITPDSMTHDRVVRRNEAGEIIAVQHSGPNGLQLTTQAGILIDKAMSVQDKAAQLRGENTGTLGPSDFAQLIETINGRINRLTDLKVDFDAGKLQAQVIELADRAQLNESIPADFEVLEDGESDSDS